MMMMMKNYHVSQAILVYVCAHVRVCVRVVLHSDILLDKAALEMKCFVYYLFSVTFKCALFIQTELGYLKVT